MTYKLEVLADSPVAYWRLGETTGTSATDIAGTNTGTYASGFTLNQIGAILTDRDPSVLFDGSAAKMSAPNSASLDITGSALSLECWVIKASGNPTAFSGIASKLNGAGTQGYQIRASNAGSGAPNFQIATSVTGLTTSSHTVSPWDGKWHHLVGTYDGGHVALYIDAVIGDNFAATGTVVSASSLSFFVGQDAGATAWFGGGVDEVAVYNTALLSTRITAHYQSGIAKLYPPKRGRA